MSNWNLGFRTKTGMFAFLAFLAVFTVVCWGDVTSKKQGHVCVLEKPVSGPNGTVLRWSSINAPGDVSYTIYGIRPGPLKEGANWSVLGTTLNATNTYLKGFYIDQDWIYKVEARWYE